MLANLPVYAGVARRRGGCSRAALRFVHGSRPNKWTVEQVQQDGSSWLEASFARDADGDPYCAVHVVSNPALEPALDPALIARRSPSDTELWERLPGGDASGVILAMRSAPECSRDSFVVVVGDHFSYIRARLAMRVESILWYFFREQPSETATCPLLKGARASTCRGNIEGRHLARAVTCRSRR